METENKKFIKDDETVTMYSCGNYSEIINCKHNTPPVNVKRLTKTQYFDRNTNEIKKYHHSSFKSLDNFKKQFKTIPRLIRGYFNGDDTERFITLTYSFVMDNPYNLPYDFKKFIRKVERRYCKCRYIYIKEPNRQGSWHIHSLIKRMDGKSFDITVETVRSLWTNGHEVSVEIPYDIDSLPYYFDITRTIDKESRIMFYPSYIKIYGHSKDMKIQKIRGHYKDLKPTESEMKKVYETENNYYSIDPKSGEIIGQWDTVYEQYKKI